MKELPKIYEPQQVEGRIYQMWMDHDCFKAEPDPDKKPFSIVMPPPNVTGQLHMGHAMDSTLQDILTRFKRMQGYSALWLPGTDHAGIATQIKVEEELRTKEGLTRYDLGREKFLQRVWQWKEKYGNRIVEQQKKMGASCDWSRSRFTMDEGCSKAVRETWPRTRVQRCTFHAFSQVKRYTTTRPKLQAGRELYLIGKGCDIIARDWVCDGGSIDVVARDGRELVFASVEIGDGSDASLAISSPEKRSITASLMLAFAAR